MSRYFALEIKMYMNGSIAMIIANTILSYFTPIKIPPAKQAIILRHPNKAPFVLVSSICSVDTSNNPC